MERRQFLHNATASIAAFLTAQHAWPQSASRPDPQKRRPNIVFILADDMGYGDVQCLNEKSKIPTPNFDQVAKNGITFTDAHSGSSVCTPTRYGLLTGRYCWRTRLTRGVQDGYGPSLIDPKRMTVASLLKNAGYSTGIVGKWHLGLDYEWINKDEQRIDTTKPIKNAPPTYGFDYSYIIPASLDFPPYGYIEGDRFVEPLSHTQERMAFPEFLRNGPVGETFDFEKSLDHLTEKAVEFIAEKSHKPNPFFLYFPLTAPHKPVIPAERFEGSTELGPYGDFIAQVDWTIGQVQNALEDAGVKEDTLLVVTSDNGSFMYELDADAADHTMDETVQGYRPSNHRANHILRGTKADIWEAGHRVPFFVQWPHYVQAGTFCKSTICLTDFFATCAEITGQSIPENAGEDSFSFAPLLLNNRQMELRPPVIHHSANGTFAIREGDYKLVLSNGSGGRETPKGDPFKKPYKLFNLRNDISETNNLAPSSKRDEKLEPIVQTFRNEGRSVPVKQW